MIGLLGVLVFLLVAAAYTSLLIVERQAALREVSRYNTTWLVSQAALEVARLHGMVGAASIPGSGFDEDDVSLRLDIVANRVQLFSGGEIAEFVANAPDRAAKVHRLGAMTAAARAILDGPPAPDRLQRLLPLVSELLAPMAQLAAAANTHGGELVAQDQTQLSKLHWTFAAILGAMTLCGFGLVGVLTWHNWLLAQAADETQRQNGLLQVRDFELNTQNARFNAALDNMSQALCMMDSSQRLIVCNLRFLELFGISEADARPGTHAGAIFAAVADAGQYGADMIKRIATRSLGNTRPGEAFAASEHDEVGRALAVSHEPLSGGGWVATFEDVTERRRTEARISFMAHHDALTELPNRLLFHTRLGQALERYATSGDSVAVLCLDLDRFKEVNDTFGHPAGDGLLQAMAVRLQRCVRDSDLVVRLGGDEFAILQVGAEQPMAAEALARRVVDEVAQPHDIESQRVVVGTSIGIALAAPDLAKADLLLKSADIALYRAKEAGRGAFRFFERAMDTEMQARRALEADLRQAVARDELELLYQPIIRLQTGRTSGFEALLRWRHPVRGLVSPTVFVPLAEEIGLIGVMGQWVLNRACMDAATWPSDVKLAVNLSPLQFRTPNLPAIVEQALAQSGLQAARLELEITESALLQDSETVLATLHQLCALGLRIALDDFGTGFSSLSYLRSFPFHKLKIDRSFIKEIADRPDCEAIVQLVTSLAHTLGMTTTAEGVETALQLTRLKAVGCTEVQGFLFAAPLPLDEVMQWLSDTPASFNAWGGRGRVPVTCPQMPSAGLSLVPAPVRSPHHAGATQEG